MTRERIEGRAPSYSPDLKSLRKHVAPAWWRDAKLGIFIHWTPASVPGWAPVDLDINEISRDNYHEAIAYSPYTEWYGNSMKVEGSPVWEYHRSTYGDRTYESFASDFEDALSEWDPTDWARRIKATGARYVVFVTKHHDGYCLWPSSVKNPNRDGWHSKRDLVGELGEAVRGEGLRFGTYYSGGLDWSFEAKPLKTVGDIISSIPRGAYLDYADAQVRELITRYRPDVLWNDIAWPTSPKRLWRLFADYYAAVPEGVVNDRWAPAYPVAGAMALSPVKWAFDQVLARQAREPDSGLIPPEIGHLDYRTPEYITFDQIRTRPWECVRGIDKSFGYNRNSDESHFLTHEDLIHSLVDIVSKNGNLMLNIGPRGEDAAIPDEQQRRLDWLGAWLGDYGEAIFSTRPWVRPDGFAQSPKSGETVDVRFTTRGESTFATLLGPRAKNPVELDGISATATAAARDVAGGQEVTIESAAEQGNVRVDASGGSEGEVAHSIELTGVRCAE